MHTMCDHQFAFDWQSAVIEPELGKLLITFQK